ncbi:MAG: ABC transporter ATP-binding protein [Halothiobacillus sp.]
MTDISIRIDGLGKRFDMYVQPFDRLRDLFHREPKHGRPFWALQDVTFECRAGETIGIIGRNGSGKSTLLQMLCGTLTPTTGTVQVQGRVAALLELGAGFNPEFTGLENVRLNAVILGLSPQQIEERIPAILEFADIGDFVHQPVKVYSSGMFLRLAFAVIAHVDADILVVDEALAVGDVVFVQKCMRFLRRFRERGILIFVSHDAGMVTGLCDRAIWLNQGQVMLQGEAADIVAAYIEFTYAADQDVGGAKKLVNANTTARTVPPLAQPGDFRHEQISAVAPNPIRVFNFTEDSLQGFGTGNAEISQVVLQDDTGAALPVIMGGEQVTLLVHWTARVPIQGPIVGFMLKDRKGQFLFGDNTFLTESTLTVPAGHTARAEFCFRMPYLPKGDYAITVAIAEGTQDEHVQHQWVHEAVLLRSNTSHVAGGLIGLPMERISLTVG